MVCGAVLAHDARTVQTKDHVLAADGHVVNDVVVGTLCKTGVNVAHRYESVLCHTGREGYGMPLGNSHIEASVGHLLHHYVHGASCGHGRGHANYTVVLACHFQQGFSEHVLITGRHVGRGIVADALSRFGVELAGCMEGGGVLHGRLVAVAFLRVYVQESRAAHFLYAAQGLHQGYNVVSVLRAEVAYVYALEHVVLVVYEGLYGVVQSYDALLALFGEPSPVGQFVCRAVAEAVVCAACVQVVQVGVHASHGTVYAHVVVVQDNEHVVGRGASIVQSLEGQTSAHCSVAYDGNDMPVGTLLLGRYGHTQGRRYAH